MYVFAFKNYVHLLSNMHQTVFRVAHIWDRFALIPTQNTNSNPLWNRFTSVIFAIPLSRRARLATRNASSHIGVLDFGLEATQAIARASVYRICAAWRQIGKLQHYNGHHNSQTPRGVASAASLYLMWLSSYTHENGPMGGCARMTVIYIAFNLSEMCQIFQVVYGDIRQYWLKMYC